VKKVFSLSDAAFAMKILDLISLVHLPPYKNAKCHDMSTRKRNT